MKQSTVVPIHSDIHIHGCSCSICEPYTPSVQTFSRAVTVTCLWILSGMTAGTMVVCAVKGAGPVFRALVGL